MNKIIRDCAGSSLVEFTLVFPIVMMVTFCTVDFTYMLHEWNLASKATYRGAREAIVRNPVAPAVFPLYAPAEIGNPCFNSATGAATGACPPVDVTCTGTAGCTNAAAFTAIVQAMQAVFPRIDSTNVQIRYQTTGLGFAGRPNGLPMNVTVSLQCMSHRMFFLGAWAGWFFPPAQACQPANSVAMPTFASTLPSEDMVTN